MKKHVLVIGVLVIGLTILAQEIQHETIAINIEVPVRVFTKGKFAEELTIKDFELYEDGIPQEILALYLVKKTVIEREDTKIDTKQANKIFLPETSRTFVLMFEMMDYFPQTREALDYFYESVISPGDSLFVITPSNNYSFKKELLDKAPREEIVDQLSEKLMKDIRYAAIEYKSLVRDLEFSAKMGGDSDLTRGILEQIRGYRYFDEKKLIEFKDQLKDIEGQKYVFLFYQQLLIPLSLGVLYDSGVQISFNIKEIKQIFADASIFINFIFLIKKQIHQLDVTRKKSRSNLELTDISLETFGAFHEMAKATGGITDSSANIASSFQRAAISSENYYLLYYAPKNHKADGKFKNIKVKVKGKNYRVIHRAGYIAD